MPHYAYSQTVLKQYLALTQIFHKKTVFDNLRIFRQ